MQGLSINYAPLMTTFIVQQTALLRDDPIVLLDVGARGGIGREWEALGDRIRVYAFEPDIEECRALAKGAPANLTYIPHALGRSRETRTLHLAAHAASSGLYANRMDYLSRFLNRDNAVSVGESKVEVMPLDDIVEKYGVRGVDFIKLDVEGAELDVLEGGKRFLQRHPPLGVLSEIRFHEEINGSPPFAVLDAYLRNEGLRLFDLQVHHQSRIAMPYPGLAHFSRPDGTRFFAQTSRGQIQDGDALYLRDLLLPSSSGAASPALDAMPASSIVKMCIFMEIFSLNDCAAELILAARPRLDALVDTGRLLDLLASGICGEPTTHRDYLARYFADPPPVVGQPIFPRHKPGAAAMAWLRRLFGPSSAR